MYKKYLKRIFDFIFSLFMIVILCPVFLIVSILIKIMDKSNIIYKQVRTGKNGKEFIIYKFKTIKDKKISKFGRFLRKYGIDELPQLFNILKGDMSLIGPRPWIIDYYKYFDERQKKRTSVRPGLIGLAQIKGNDIDVFEKIDLDLKYVDNISFILDLKIVVKTFFVVVLKKHNEITISEIEDELEILSKHYNLKSNRI